MSAVCRRCEQKFTHKSVFYFIILTVIAFLLRLTPFCVYCVFWILLRANFVSSRWSTLTFDSIDRILTSEFSKASSHRHRKLSKHPHSIQAMSSMLSYALFILVSSSTTETREEEEEKKGERQISLLILNAIQNHKIDKNVPNANHLNDTPSWFHCVRMRILFIYLTSMLLWYSNI